MCMLKKSTIFIVVAVFVALIIGSVAIKKSFNTTPVQQQDSEVIVDVVRKNTETTAQVATTTSSSTLVYSYSDDLKFVGPQVGDEPETIATFYFPGDVYFPLTNLATNSRIKIAHKTKQNNEVCDPMYFFVSGNLAPTATSTVMIGEHTWVLAKTSDAAMSNYYDDTIHMLDTGSDCYAVELFIHTTNPDVYDYDISAVDTELLQSYYSRILTSAQLKK